MSNIDTTDAPPPADVRERLFDAHQRLERLKGRRTITAGTIHERVAPFLKRSVTSATVSRWLSGATEPPPDAVRALARLYGVRYAWLLDGDGPMLASESGGASEASETGGATAAPHSAFRPAPPSAAAKKAGNRGA